MLNVYSRPHRVLRRTTLSAIIAGILAPTVAWVPSVANAQVTLGTGASADFSSVAIGNNAAATSSSTAVGGNATASGMGSTSVGTNASSGNDGTAMGTNANAGASATAIGLGATASADDVAIGGLASSTGSNSVAVGYNSNDDGRANVFSIGAVGSERQLINVAAGTSGTDAVNVNQLAAVVSTLGGGASVLNGVITPPTYLIATTTGTASFSTVGDALSSLGTRVTALESSTGSSATDVSNEVNVQIGSGASSTGPETTAVGAYSSATGQYASAYGASAKAAGDYSVGIGYLSNAYGSQSVSIGYQASSASTSVAYGAYATSYSYAVALGVSTYANTWGVAVGQQASAANYDTSVGALTSTTGSNSVAIGYESSDYGRSNTVSIGTPGSERTLSNLAAGTQGTDAVNLNQLSSVASTLGGSFDSNGTYVPPTYTLSSGTYSTVSAVFTNLDTRLEALESSASTGGTGGVTEAYVQQQVASAVSTVETYTDQQSTAAVTTANAYTDQKVASVTTGTGSHSGSGDATTLTSAYAYTDQKSSETLAAANSYTDQQTTAAVSTAKSYTDQVASTTLSSAKSYTDQQVSALSSSVDQRFAGVNQSLNDLSRRLDGIGAMGAAASSNLYNPDSAHDFQMGIGLASYRGAVGYSVGAFHRWGNVVANLKVSGATQSAGVAVSGGINVGF